MQISFFNAQVLQKRKNAAKLFSIFLATLLISAGFAPSAYASYPLARITNNTEYTVVGEVQYVSFLCEDDKYSVGPGKTWTASSRGVCLIDDITGSTKNAIGKYGESTRITPYHASPATTYSKFQINAFSGSYRIFSEDEWDDVSDTKQGKSPGFYFVNKTAWPLTYSLDQVGCLYHGIIPAGEGEKGVRKVDTGAVWFTLRVAIQPDGIDPQSNWDCVEPVAELVGDVALAAVSGGGSAVAKAGGKVIVKQIAKEAVKAGAKKAAKEIAKNMRNDLTNEVLGKLLTDAGSVELYGQYAGYEWPFRCDNMPEYHITGGPVPLRDEDGELYLERGIPFKVSKVNGCGDDMMLGSRRSMTSDQSAFSSWSGGGGNTIPATEEGGDTQWGPETGDPSCVTFYQGINASGAKLQRCGTDQYVNWAKYIGLHIVGTDFSNRVKSFRCNSGIKSVQFIELDVSGYTPIGDFSCRGGNIVNTDGTFKNATGFRLTPKVDPRIAAEAARDQELHRQQAAALDQQRAAEASRIAAQEGAAKQTAIARQLYDTCQWRGSVQSVSNPGDQAIAIQMFNRGSRNIHIYKIDAQGQEVNHASQDVPILSISPGPAGNVDYGVADHWYIAVDDNGECVGIGSSLQSNGQLDFNPDLVVPGTHPRKAVSNAGGYDQGGYGYDGSDYVDPNEYADQDVYQEDTSDYDNRTQFQGPGCEYFGQVVSNHEGAMINVQLENYSDDTINVYWINASGAATSYYEDGNTVATMPAQSSHGITARVGHLFIATDSYGSCMGLTEATIDGETIGFSALQ